MLNPGRRARVAGSHDVSPFDFDPEVTASFDFPDPLALIDSTLRKTHFTAGHTTTRLGFQRIAAALEELGVRDCSINVSWSGSDHPSPQDWALLEAVVEGRFSFRLNVYTDTLLGNGRDASAVSMRQTVDQLAEAGVRVAAPGIVPAPDAEAQARQLAELEDYFAYSAQIGLETTITLANVGRRDFPQMLTAANHAVRLGATRLDLMDSTSSLSPEAMKVFVRRFRAGLDQPVPVTMHVHDEFGLATAGAVAAATAGASPDVSMNGMSYRAGFAPLEEVVLALETLYGVDTGLHLDRIQHTAEVVARESGVPLPPLKPLTGGYAYLKHMPGDAAAAIRDGQHAFPPISHGLVPGQMGQTLSWVWGGLSSDAMVTALAGRAGVEVDADEVAVVRRALDLRVAGVSFYPRWLDADQASAAFADVLAGLRRPLEPGELHAALAAACPEPGWLAAVAHGAGPAAGAATAIESARRHTLGLTDPELQAMIVHFSQLGRIDRARDPERAAFSVAEERGLDDGADDVRAEVVAAAEEYERVFGYRYIVFTTGSSAVEMLARLRTRLRSTPEAEARTVRRELAAIIDNRLISWSVAAAEASR